MAVIMGTAGHIDHGKTTLVRALTGIDCDRLGEEKRRGITIELGFAWLDLPGGERLGIVDVPGHERFVKNMVAGAAGIDFVMLVIAADEGVMPQTREHLEICSLLGIRHGFVALTKTDMVDADWLGLVTEDVRTFLEGTFLEGAAILPVAASTGEGLDAVKAHIAATAANLPRRHTSDIFRLPVDRVFSLKGHGTVVTGTVISGSVKAGEAVSFMPGGVATRARSLQCHGAAADGVDTGHRCAVNVQGLEVGDIERGQVLTAEGALESSRCWLVRLTCLPSAPRPIRQRVEIHFHHGTRECPARLVWRDRDKLAPGETALAEVRFGEPMAGVFGDHCVARAYSPLRTVAGGMLVCPLPPGLRAADPQLPQKMRQWLALPEQYEQAVVGKAPECAVMLESVLQLAGKEGATLCRLRQLTGLTAPAIEAALQLLGSRGAALCVDKESRHWLAKGAFEALQDACLARAAELHGKDPLKPTFARNALLGSWSRRLSDKLVHKVLEQALKQGKMVAEGDGLRLASHKVTLAADSAGLREKLLAAHRDAGLTPPNYKDVLEELGVSSKEASPVLRLLCEAGELVKIKDGLYYDGAVLADILTRVRTWFESHDNLDIAGLKEILGLSRKFLVALLEYMDNEHITVRIGDQRKLRKA